MADQSLLRSLHVRVSWDDLLELYQAPPTEVLIYWSHLGAWATAITKSPREWEYHRGPGTLGIESHTCWDGLREEMMS